jgi:hypothetical protein
MRKRGSGATGEPLNHPQRWVDPCHFATVDVL